VANKKDIRKHVTAIPAKTLALRVFIGQGVTAKCLMSDKNIFFLFLLVFKRIKHRNASSQI